MAVVVAVGLNPAIDRILVVPGFSVGATLKAKSVETLPSGKGTNVAAVLHLLGVDVRHTGFVGVAEAEAYRRRLDGVSCSLIEIEGRTRIDTTIIDPGTDGGAVAGRVGSETHIREPGFTVSARDMDRFRETFVDLLNGADLVTFSGSLPPGVPKEAYRDLTRLCADRGVRTFLDTSGEALRIGVTAAPTFLKPNDEELAELTGRPARDTGTIVAAARELIASGTEAVAVSLGAEGAVLVERNGAWKGCAIASRVINTVGCGDAFASGWLAARLAGASPAEQLREALALGAANAMTHGAGVIDPAHIELMRAAAEVRQAVVGTR